MKLHPKFMTDKKGKEFVVLPAEEYRKMLEELEELDEEFIAAIERGLKDMEEGKSMSFEEVFERPQRERP